MKILLAAAVTVGFILTAILAYGLLIIVVDIGTSLMALNAAVGTGWFTAVTAAITGSLLWAYRPGRGVSPGRGMLASSR